MEKFTTVSDPDPESDTDPDTESDTVSNRCRILP
jgi:hypothetical protein